MCNAKVAIFVHQETIKCYPGLVNQVIARSRKGNVKIYNIFTMVVEQEKRNYAWFTDKHSAGTSAI